MTPYYNCHDNSLAVTMTPCYNYHDNSLAVTMTPYYNCHDNSLAVTMTPYYNYHDNSLAVTMTPYYNYHDNSLAVTMTPYYIYRDNSHNVRLAEDVGASKTAAALLIREEQLMFDPETNEISFVKEPSCKEFPVEFDPKTKKIVHKPGANKCKKMVMTMEKDYEIEFAD
ncbi:hypothetical protein QZH41_006305 [Actinostola sp. cb2023]|nr:hypothetical protein QZH41_006305 [Actinostola sp. cb2023]